MHGIRDSSETFEAPPASDPTALGAVELVQVTPHGWRVSDNRLPSRDPRHLLAYVERHGDLFEVMQLGSGFEWHTFSSLDHAVAFVLRTAAHFAQARLLPEERGSC